MNRGSLALVLLAVSPIAGRAAADDLELWNQTLTLEPAFARAGLFGGASLHLGSYRKVDGDMRFGEQIVRPANDGSLKIAGQTPMAARMFDELKGKAACFGKGYAAATGGRPQSAMVSFGGGCASGPRGVVSDRGKGKMSLHSAGLACDLTTVSVQGSAGAKTFSYREAFSHRGDSRNSSSAYFTAFRSCWGWGSLGWEDKSGNHDALLHLSVFHLIAKSCGPGCAFAHY